MTDGLGHLGQKGHFFEPPDSLFIFLPCPDLVHFCLFCPSCAFINKNKEERMRYDYENDENKQKRDNYGDWD